MKMKSMTKEQFEKQYAKNSNMTVEQLHKLGLRALPCICNYEDCKGWQMRSNKPEIIDEHNRFADGLICEDLRIDLMPSKLPKNWRTDGTF